MEYTETWPRCPEAARFFDDRFHAFAEANEQIVSMTTRFLEGAGVDLRYLVDHWALPDTDGSVKKQVVELGFEERTTVDGDAVMVVPGARLPRVRLSATLARPRIAIAVDDVAHFLKSNNLTPNVQAGDPDSSYEEARIAMHGGELAVIARRGYDGYRPGTLTDKDREAIAEVRQEFSSRDRTGDEVASIGRAREMFERAAAAIGQARACDEFFASERDYYMTRNKAAHWIYKQQVGLGFGWANHDHHTYRNRRDTFYDLMNLFHAMGFIAREKFYAGADAGWGAQVMEHPISRVVLFNDLDISPEELAIDYSQTRLGARNSLGTIGLWCALHGSSIAEAGMHHIECEYDFEAASKLFQAKGYMVMKPFTDLPILKQRFTEPELWQVSDDRLEAVLQTGAITSDQAQTFRDKGAAGSHVEILQRWEGFKGFNKTGVSNIIRETDARNAAAV